MSQISDGLWEIIRSAGGMKTEITETVQSVYNQLLNPQGLANGESHSSWGQVLPTKGAEFSGSFRLSGEKSGPLSKGEVNAPPGFSLKNHVGSNPHEPQSQTKEAGPSSSRPQEPGREPHSPCSNGPLQTEDGDPSPPPGFSLNKRKQPSDSTDEDPDIPPGFG